MAAWKRKGGLEHFETAPDRRHARARLCARVRRAHLQQILGFGEYGFPESHAASFALLVYVSAWLKRHDPAAFLAALLNSQPMGFYAPAQLVQDARRHGVEVRPVDVLASDWECTLEPDANGMPAVRLGLLMVKGLSGAGAARIVSARAERLLFGRGTDAPRAARSARTQMPRGERRAGTHRRPPAARLLAGRRRGHRAALAIRSACPRNRSAICARRAKATASSPITAAWDSPWAGTRWRCCARALHACGSPPPKKSAACRTGQRARGRHRHRPAAPRHHIGRGVRHAGGRDRLRQCHRLARPGRAPAARTARRAADGGIRIGRTRRRSSARDRETAGRSQRVARQIGDQLAGFSLGVACAGAALPGTPLCYWLSGRLPICS